MIVVDTNVISYFYLSGQRSEQAGQAMEIDPQWAAPRLWRSEFRNVLILSIRHRHLTLETAVEVMDKSLRLMAGREYDVASSRVLRLAATSRCSAYDCEFVALAEHLGVPLITVDKQVLAQFPDVAISLDAFVAA
jgi:predicted nucleic acid-binding protein